MTDSEKTLTEGECEVMSAAVDTLVPGQYRPASEILDGYDIRTRVFNEGLLRLVARGFMEQQEESDGQTTFAITTEGWEWFRANGGSLPAIKKPEI